MSKQIFGKCDGLGVIGAINLSMSSPERHNVGRWMLVGVGRGEWFRPCKVRTELEEWVEAAERRELSESAIPQHPAEELEVSPLPLQSALSPAALSDEGKHFSSWR